MNFSLDSIDGKGNVSEVLEDKPSGEQEVVASVTPSLSSPHERSSGIISVPVYSEREQESSLSPWEKWVVRKAWQERKRREKERMLKVSLQTGHLAILWLSGNHNNPPISLTLILSTSNDY